MVNGFAGNRETLAHLSTATFIDQARNQVLLGATGHRVLFATATEWVTRLQSAHQSGRLASELAG